MKRVLLVGVLSLSAAMAAPVTFNQDIAPIVYEKCSRCHRAGETAPFALISYEDVAKRGKMIAAVTASRYMPPWKAEPASFPYKDARRLTDGQLALIQTWVKEGMPRGTGSAPAPPQFPEGWQLGTPDLVVEMPKAFHVPAEGPDIYRNIVIPLDLPQDEWVRAIELRPTSHGVIHHVLFFADATGEARKRDAGGDEFQGMRFTRGWTPLGGIAVGGQPHLLPNGVGLSLKKGSDLVFQYHFHPSGKAETEKSVVGLYFAKKTPEHTLTNIQLPPAFGLFSSVKIAGGEKEFRVRDSYVLPVAVDVVSVGAHAHYLGKTMKMTAALPDGSVKTLLQIKDWDFAWQDQYFFEQAVTLPKGTRIDAEVTWDNSEGNPRNPSSPPVSVQWGEGSKDEMGAVSMQVYPRLESDLKTLRADYAKHVGRIAIPRLMSDRSLRQWVMEHAGPSFGGGAE